MNNYHIYEEIGKGRSSIVYKGRLKKQIEYIAVKSLEKDRRKKVMNEVKVISDLDHENILKFYKWYETRNHLWMIYEYCAGGDLMQLIEQDKCLTEPVLKQFSRSLLSGLSYLHSYGIIYCDMKPSNILINEYGILKLSDFGLAKKIVDLIATHSSEKQDQKRGNPYYTAPELFQENGVHSFQSDLWAFGCVMHELATGKPPFVSKSFSELLNMIVKSPTPKVEKFTKEFNHLLNSLLEKDPLKRISWSELALHPFWGENKLIIGKIPSQPHFDNWVQQYHQSSNFFSQNDNQNKQEALSLADRLKQQGGKSPLSQQEKQAFNPLRLSLQVVKDQQRQQNDYNTDNINVNDLELRDRNQEIGWGDQKNEDDDEDNNIDEQVDFYQTQNINRNNSNNNLAQQYPVSPMLPKEEELKVEKFNNLKHIETNNNKKKFNQAQNQQDELNQQFPSSSNNNPNYFNQNQYMPQTPKSPIDGFQTPVAKVKQVPLEQLFTHNSDNAVKPIIGNKEIEKLQDVAFNEKALPFKAFPPDEVINCVESPMIEEHFEKIYTSLIPANSDKLSILNYFENIIQHSNVSNRLINSSLFLKLLLKLLKTSKIIAIKIRLASIIGLLIRHSTVIENEVSQVGIGQTMIEVLKNEKNEKLKRRAIAALGEYLFYAATQIDEDPQNQIWAMDQFSYQILLKIIKNKQEDELVQFYASKTIENITAQSVTTGQQFATQEIALSLASLYYSAKNESLKICAIVTLTHITGVDSPPRIQQAFLTIINMQILNSGGVTDFIQEQEVEFTDAIVHLLESQSTVIRGKAILTLLLLIKINGRTLIFMTRSKFFPILEKLQRDNYKYVQQCLFHMQELLDDMLPHILKFLLDEFSKMQDQDFQQFLLEQNYSQQYNQLQQQNLPGNLQFLDVIMAYLSSNSLKIKIYNHKYLETIFALVDFCEQNNQSANSQNSQEKEAEVQQTSKIIEDAKSYLFQLYEMIIHNSKYVLNNHDFFIKQLLPKICQNIFRSQQVDLRFNNLKIFINILSLIMNDAHIYDNSKIYGKQLNEFLIQEILPNINNLLGDTDPVPFYGLKLINLLVEQNQSIFVSYLRRQKLHLVFYEYFKKDHPRLTKNTLRIICQLISFKEVTIDELLSINILQNSISIFKQQIQLQQDWALEDLMEIILISFKKLFETLQKQNVPIQNPDSSTNLTSFPYKEALSYLQNNFDLILDLSEQICQLLNNQDYNIQEKSAHLCQYLIYVFSYQPAEKVFNQKALNFVLDSIQKQSKQLKSNLQLMKSNNTQLNATDINDNNFKSHTFQLNNFYRKLSKILCWGLQISQGRSNLLICELRDKVAVTLEAMASEDDNIINYYTKEIIKILG
ncbi:Protein kinase-like domain [Pseudocohnilembus persalinus]|uniref:Protein kinase-like domain n=1 Tax=Pseudocohnilembus persalinus TaxID=266149 RepID=A0A0V0R214_PSEPJ|nr:Protein kinase-like domain [Pseudocohnilembus persalinus]|eukprot:KRX08559.1 Protein kinase-like domain [Pseudocohnilembus persalinus]